MLKKIIVTAALGATVVGGGTAALANPSSANTSSASSSTTNASSAKNSSAKNKAAHKRLRGLRLGRALLATWVTKNVKTSAVVTHDAIHGTVSSVSATAITLRAADGVRQTYRVNSATKVVRRTTKAAPSTIGAVKVGDHAVVVGTGTSTLTARRIVDGLKK